MKHSKIIITIFFATFIGNYLVAQDTIMNKEVEVIKAFQPTISDANKIATSPKVTDTVKYTPVFDYKIQSSLIPVSRSIQNLPVVQLGNPPQSKSNTGYVRAGIGNALTPFAEVVINTSPNKSTDFGLTLSHFSSDPSIKLDNGLKVKSPYSNDQATIFVRNKFRKVVLDWNVGFERNMFHYYGFPDNDSLLYRDSEKTSNTLNKKQVFNNTSALFNLRKIDSKSNFVYNVSLGYNYFWNITGQRVHQGSYNGNYMVNKRTFNIRIGSELNYFFLDSIQNPYKQKLNHQFVYARLSPQYIYEKNNLSLSAGLNISTIMDNDTSAIFHISPKIYFEYQPIKNILSLFAGTDGKLNSNDYHSMTLLNRYISCNNEIKPSREMIDLFGGLKGKFSQNISYVFDVAYSVKSDEPFWYYTSTRYPSASDITDNLFSVKYADLNVFRLGGNIRYSSKNIIVALKGNYYNYDTKNLTFAITHLPNFDAGLNSIFKVGSQFKIRFDAMVIGPRKGEVVVKTYNLDPETNLLAEPVLSDEIQKLKTIININAGFDYDFNKKLSISLDIMNLINQKYEVWNGYNSQGILIIAGARYIF